MQVKHILGFFSGVNKVKVSSASGPPNAFTSPLGETTIHAGQTMELTWDNPTGPVADISLVHVDPSNLVHVSSIANGIPNEGSVYWTVPDTVAPGDYAVKLYTSDGNVNFSPFFHIYDPVSPVRW